MKNIITGHPYDGCWSSFDKAAEYGMDWTCVHDAKNKYSIVKNKLLVYGGV